PAVVAVIVSCRPDGISRSAECSTDVLVPSISTVAGSETSRRSLAPCVVAGELQSSATMAPMLQRRAAVSTTSRRPMVLREPLGWVTSAKPGCEAGDRYAEAAGPGVAGIDRIPLGVRGRPG